MSEINLMSNIELVPNNENVRYNKVQSVALGIHQRMMNEAAKIPQKINCSLCNKTFSEQGKLETMGMRTHFHGSEFGKCYRQVQYNLARHKQLLDGQKKIFLEDGLLHEEMYNRLLSHSFLIEKAQEETIVKRRVKLIDLSVEQEVVISTHNDLRITYDQYKYIVEFKAVKNWFTKNRYQNRVIPMAYYGQCQIYMVAANYKYAILWFKSRESSQIFPPFVIERNEDYINERFKYLALTMYMMGSPQRQALEVPREYNDKNCDACKFCDHREPCWGI